jgi:RNA 2',3'-cyclic 3'-phosphodiesterase
MDRLFLALPLDDATREGLARELRDRVGPLPGRAVAPRNWHLTLRFLGDTDAATRQRLCAALDAAQHGPALPLRFAGLGAFPAPQRAAVLWLGVGEGAGALGALAARVAAAAHEAGIAPDAKPFRAHLTLSRLRPPRDVRPLLARGAALSLPMLADRVVLYRSRLAPAGPSYEPLREWRLGPDPGPPA